MFHILLVAIYMDVCINQTLLIIYILLFSYQAYAYHFFCNETNPDLEAYHLDTPSIV